MVGGFEGVCEQGQSDEGCAGGWVGGGSDGDSADAVFAEFKELRAGCGNIRGERESRRWIGMVIGYYHGARGWVAACIHAWWRLQELNSLSRMLMLQWNTIPVISARNNRSSYSTG